MSDSSTPKDSADGNLPCNHGVRERGSGTTGGKTTPRGRAAMKSLTFSQRQSCRDGIIAGTVKDRTGAQAAAMDTHRSAQMQEQRIELIKRILYLHETHFGGGNGDLLFCVTVLCARLNLESEALPPSNMYCELTLRGLSHTTKVKRASLEPKWNETFLFGKGVRLLGSDDLSIALKDAEDVGMNQVKRIQLATLREYSNADENTFWLDLDDSRRIRLQLCVHVFTSSGAGKNGRPGSPFSGTSSLAEDPHCKALIQEAAKAANLSFVDPTQLRTVDTLEAISEKEEQIQQLGRRLHDAEGTIRRYHENLEREEIRSTYREREIARLTERIREFESVRVEELWNKISSLEAELHKTTTDYEHQLGEACEREQRMSALNAKLQAQLAQSEPEARHAMSRFFHALREGIENLSSDSTGRLEDFEKRLESLNEAVKEVTIRVKANPALIKARREIAQLKSSLEFAERQLKLMENASASPPSRESSMRLHRPRPVGKSKNQRLSKERRAKVGNAKHATALPREVNSCSEPSPVDVNEEPESSLDEENLPREIIRRRQVENIANKQLEEIKMVQKLLREPNPVLTILQLGEAAASLMEAEVSDSSTSHTTDLSNRLDDLISQRSVLAKRDGTHGNEIESMDRIIEDLDREIFKASKAGLMSFPPRGSKPTRVSPRRRPQTARRNDRPSRDSDLFSSDNGSCSKVIDRFPFKDPSLTSISYALNTNRKHRNQKNPLSSRTRPQTAGVTRPRRDHEDVKDLFEALRQPATSRR